LHPGDARTWISLTPEVTVASLKSGIELVKATFRDFSEDEATWKAAALAYYTVFALPPLLVLLLQVASAIWDPAEVRRSLTGEFQSLMGKDVAGQIQTMIASAENKTSGKGLRLVMSIAGLVFGATGAFVSLQSALNRAWEVEPDPKQGGVKNFVMKRFLSLGMVLGIAFLLLVSLALTSVLSAAGGAILGGLPEAVGHVLNFALSFVVVTLLFAGIFKILPDAKIGWRDVWVGAVVTALLFVIGKFAIGLYIGRSDPGSAFGAASALAVLLVWIYYAAVIVLLGAEFTQAWVKQRGRDIEPKEGAVRVVERKQRENEGTSEGTKRGTGERSHDNRTRTEAAMIDDRAIAAGGVSTGALNDAGNKSTAAARQEIVATRARMSGTIAEIESRISGTISNVKQKVDVVALVKEHPWTALAAAVVAGVALSATGADRKAATATVDAAKRAPGGVKQGARAAAAGVSHLASAAAQRFKGSSDESATESTTGSGSTGLIGRLSGQARQLEDELRNGVNELPGADIPRRNAGI
jgi:membrane protein